MTWRSTRARRYESIALLVASRRLRPESPEFRRAWDERPWVSHVVPFLVRVSDGPQWSRLPFDARGAYVDVARFAFAAIVALCAGCHFTVAST